MEQSKTYSFDEAYSEALKYFSGDELAARVWVSKHALRDRAGNLREKSPEDMHWRMANEIARIEKKYENPMSVREVFGLLDRFRYVVPGGSLMTGIGNDDWLGSLGNGFVIGLEGDADSYGAIMRADEEQVQLMRRGGGVGHDLSHIRPKGSPVDSPALTSSGLTPFMERYGNSAREVAGDGRRGALMLSVSVRHPDIEALIDAGMTGGMAAGASVSVKVDDAFMEAAANGKPYAQQFPVDGDEPLVRREVSAKALWGKIVHNAWMSAEPGVLFWDTVIRESVPDCYADLGFRTVSTNPCGEMPLCPYDSCRTLSVNLYSYVVHPFTKDACFDMDKFRKHVQMAQRIMDDVVDLDLEKIDRIIRKIRQDPQSDEVKDAERRLWEKIKRVSSMGRRTGVGVTAEGDMIAAMGLRYGSPEATEFSVNVHKNLALNAYRSSVTMAQERGAFAVFDAGREKDNPFLLRLKEADGRLYADMRKYGRRNIACLAIAPTGAVSLMTQTTSGVEPAFMPVYKRRRKVNPGDAGARVDIVDAAGDSFEEYIVYHRKFLEWMNVNGIDPTRKYTQEEIDGLVERSPYHKATANDVDWLEKVRMQGAIQKWVDHGISMTVNLPNDADEALVSRLYMEAWRSGCKGCAIYRDGSGAGLMPSVPKSGRSRKVREQDADDTPALNARPTGKQPEVMEVRPKELECDVVRFQNNKEKWVALVGLLDGHPYEIFTGLQDDDEGIVLPKSVVKGKIIKHKQDDGPSRYDFQFVNKRGYKTTVEGLSEKFNPEYWNYAKLISGVLRYRMPIDRVINLVASLQLKDESINTWKNGVERALKKYVDDGTEAEGQKCPVCGHETLVYQEGCLICKNCGAGRCE